MDEVAIENELNCTICLDTYTDPKILQCFHVYCQKCLVKLVTKDQQGQLSLSCPICRQITPVPAASGTRGLHSAFHVNHFLEILDKHKKAKRKEVSAERVDSKPQNLPSALCCSKHDGREVELFCETCGELISYNKSRVKGGRHHSHDYKDINESFERYKENVTPLQKPLENRITVVAKVLAQLDRHSDEITHQRATIEVEIRESSKRLHDIISNRQDQLINQLDQITKRKLKSLAAQTDQVETLQAQLSSCLEFVRESLKTDNQKREVLAMKTTVLKQVQELATPSPQTDIFSLSTEADVVFSKSVDAATVCECYGRVYTLNSPDPSKCVVSGRGTEEAVVGEKATVALTATTFKDTPCSEASVLMSFQVELVSEITGCKVFGSVEGSGEQGQYVISYQPTVKGSHQLYIKADDQYIKGGSFQITVMLPVEELGTPISSLNKLGEPWGVAVNGQGDVVVAESSSDCISVFSSCGEKLNSFGTRGSGEGQFSFPSDVTVDGEGNLFVLDEFNHRIQKFSAKGDFIKAVGSKGNGPLQFNSPSGITYCASNKKVYVADSLNHRVQVMTSDFQFISMFGKRGSGKREFIYPCGIATNSSGMVYVADCSNHCIQVFTVEGKLVKMFGRKGAGRGELNFPWGVGIDASGLVYVSENWNHRVSVFSSEGKFVTVFGGKETQFDCPRGLAVDDSGVVYVCDSDNMCIQLF